MKCIQKKTSQCTTFSLAPETTYRAVNTFSNQGDFLGGKDAKAETDLASQREKLDKAQEAFEELKDKNLELSAEKCQQFLINGVFILHLEGAFCWKLAIWVLILNVS